MSKYRDIASYNLAVKIRTYKTILVEGVTDKNLLAGFFLEKNHEDNYYGRCIIDDVSIISGDANLASLGNRNKVINIAEELSHKNEKLAYLIDREWDGIDLETLETLDNIPPENTSFLTKGHSIENYWFSCDAVISYLKHSVPGGISVVFLREIENNFGKIIAFSAAYSLAAKDGLVIKRIDDILECSDIIINADGFFLDTSFNNKLLARGSNFDAVQACNEKFLQIKGKNSEILRWICHGHLGEQAIRACVARLAINNGVDEKTSKEIERGDKAGKFKHDAKHITSCSDEATYPLRSLLAWVRS